MTKRTTLVTGGAGVIGFQLVKFLSCQDWGIYTQNNRPGYAKEDWTELKLSIIFPWGISNE